MTIFRIIVFTIGVICILGGSIGIAYLTALETTQKETKTNKKKFWITFGIVFAAYIGICFFLSYCQGYF